VNRDRDRARKRLSALAASFLAVLVLASPALSGAPSPHGVYTGTLVNEDKVQLNVSANGKSATFTVGCLDLGETYPFRRFPIAHGVFSATIPVPGSPGTAEAKLRGTFTSATRVSIVLNEHPERSYADRYICFGITSPATLTLKGK
jgi:hypothetical protein